eukprot:gene44091-54791_t
MSVTDAMRSIIPSIRPVNIPVHVPSLLPSEEPSILPTVVPSRQPSLTPSADPSCSPTRLPTLAPSDRPSVVPSALPSLQSGHTVAPSVVPSAAPSLSVTDQWKAAAQSALGTIAPKTNDAAYILTYIDLFVAETASQVYGSCSSWTSLLSSDLTLTDINYRPSAIQLSTVRLSPSADLTTFTCSNATAVRPIVKTLPTLSVGGGLRPSALSILTMTFDELQAAPVIISGALSATKTSVLVQSRLNVVGSVYCGSFLANRAPTSSAEIKLQNFASPTDSLNVSSVFMSGLSAISSYRVYCVAVSQFG